jgi:hypothetical protein
VKRLNDIIAILIIMASFSLETANSQDVLNYELLIAATEGNVEKAKSLITKGADVNTQNSLGWTPIHTAIWNSRQNIVELLIENKADINKVNGKNETPLYFAAEKGQIRTVEILITNGADINIVSDEKKNALTIAREKGYNGIAELLVKHGATEPVVEEVENTEIREETNTREEEQSINNRRDRSRITRGDNVQSREEIDILADPNEIKERIKTYEGLEKAIEEVDNNSVSEVRKWKQIRNDNRTSLIKSVERQYESEIKLVKKIAEEEKAEKTKKAIDDMIALRTERFSEINKELIVQRREQREAERDTQSTRTRGRAQATGGRAQATGREARRRGTQRGQATGIGMAGTPSGRSDAEDSRRSGMEEQEDLLDEETQEEIDLWLDSDVDDKETLAESVYEMILTEYRTVREVAVEEEAKKTAAAIDGLLLARQGRLNTIILEIAQEREDLAQLEARDQGDDARGRSRRGRGTTGTGRSSQQNQTRTRDRRR